MGNIVGEQFLGYVTDQIKARQNLYGSGFGSTNIDNSQILLLNNRNAWLKLASSVNVVNESRLEPNTTQELAVARTTAAKPLTTLGTQRLKDIRINNTADFLGNKLAQKAVLFNTLSTVTDNNKFAAPRSGVAKTNSLWNASNSYGLGGTEFGLNPAPGLISAKIDSKNRGSIRTADIEIKAFNKFQFEMLELVYLRLGFTMMLEWGWDKYIDNKKQTIENVGTTVIENQFFKSKPTSQLEMLKNIEAIRNQYQGNYDGFFGKVVNFDWNFNKNGSYDIKLKLVTLGDVVESIKTKTTAVSLSVKKIGELVLDVENEEEKKRLESLLNSDIVNNADSSPLAQSFYVDILDPKKWDNSNDNFFSWNNLQKDFTSDDAKSSQALAAFTGTPLEGEDRSFERTESIIDKNLSDPFGLKGTFKALNILFGDAVQNPLKNNDQYSYYTTFEVLLNRINKYCIPSVGANGEIEKQLKVLPVGNDNLCSAFPNQLSFDPKICLIRPILTPNMVGFPDGEDDYIKQWNWFSELRQFGFLDKDNTLLYGDIMNIYLNYDFIGKCLSQNMDEDGNISIYKFLTRICDGINSSLGGFQQLEVVVRDEVFVTIQDQNPIPGLELLYPTLRKTIVPFEIFGFNTKGTKSSNFVNDFSFNTKITPQLASSISIGTTANNVSTKNYDGTAFSKWNSGLQDRFAAFYEDPSQLEKEESKNSFSSVLTNQQIFDEWEVWGKRAKNNKFQRGNESDYDKRKYEKFELNGSPTAGFVGFADKIKSVFDWEEYPIEFKEEWYDDGYYSRQS